MVQCVPFTILTDLLYSSNEPRSPGSVDTVPNLPPPPPPTPLGAEPSGKPSLWTVIGNHDTTPHKQSSNTKFSTISLLTSLFLSMSFDVSRHIDSDSSPTGNVVLRVKSPLNLEPEFRTVPRHRWHLCCGRLSNRTYTYLAESSLSLSTRRWKCSPDEKMYLSWQSGRNPKRRHRFVSSGNPSTNFCRCCLIVHPCLRLKGLKDTSSSVVSGPVINPSTGHLWFSTLNSQYSRLSPDVETNQLHNLHRSSDTKEEKKDIFHAL